MKIMGVDFGVARTGIAISDALELTAQGVATVHSRKPLEVAEEILKYVKMHGVEKIILGLPKNMNNTIGERGEACLAFKELLEDITSIKVEMWDERLSTVSAINILNTTNTRGKKRKNVVDTVAASIILQNYLDFKNLNK